MPFFQHDEGTGASRVGPAPQPVRRRRRRSAPSSSTSIRTSCSTAARAATGLTDTGESRVAGLGRDLPAAAHRDRRRSRPAPARSRAHPRRGAADPADLAAAAGRVARARRRSPPSRSSAPLFVVGPPRSGTTILLELLALDPQLRPPLAWEALAPLPAGAARRGRHRPPAVARRVRAGVLGRHPSRVHDDARARERPAVRVRALPRRTTSRVRTGRCCTTRRASTGWQLEHLETFDARVPPAPPDAADVPVRAVRRRAEALAVEVAGPPPDAAAGVRRVSRRSRDPHASRSAQVHRVAREPPLGVAVHAQRPRRRRRARAR